MSRSKSGFKRARHAFDNDQLKRVCEMHEEEFGFTYGLERIEDDAAYVGSDYHYFKDNGADILFVAHLDTVVDHWQRTTTFVDTKGGPVVHSGALDDRLGAYIGLDLMPKLGINHDILLTVGEEQGMSTAQFFEPTREYNWMIEFDRGGTDVVMYEYEDYDSLARIRASGARVGTGSFTDICYLNHLEVKGFNWGTGYDGNYHSVRGYAYLEDTWSMVGHYLKFHEANKDVYLPHEEAPKYTDWRRQGSSHSWWRDDRTAGNDEWWDDKDPYDEKDEFAKVKALIDSEARVFDSEGRVFDSEDITDGVVIEDLADRISEESAHGDDEYAAQHEAWRGR